MTIKLEGVAKQLKWTDESLTAICAVAVVAERSFTEHVLTVTYSGAFEQGTDRRRDLWMRLTPRMKNDGHLRDTVKKMLPDNYTVSLSDDQIIVGFIDPVITVAHHAV